MLWLAKGQRLDFLTKEPGPCPWPDRHGRRLQTFDRAGHSDRIAVAGAPGIQKAHRREGLAQQVGDPVEVAVAVVAHHDVDIERAPFSEPRLDESEKRRRA